MVQGTTPLVKISASNIDLEQIEVAEIDIRQMETLVTKEGTIDIENAVISAQLTQEETLSLDQPGQAEIQLKAKLKDGNVIASKIVRVPVDKILNREVM